MQRSLTKLLFGLLCIALTTMSTQAQRNTTDNRVYFTKGIKVFTPNIKEIKSIDQIDKEERFNGRFYRYAQFDHIPTVAEHAAIKAKGITLLEYIPNKVYLASIPSTINFTSLENLGIRSLVKVEKELKVSNRLEERPFPTWAVEGNRVELMIAYYQDIPHATIKQELEQMNAVLIEEKPLSHVMRVQLLPSQLDELFNKAYLRYADLTPAPGEPESDDAKNLHRSNMLNVAYAGGRHYDGTGVNIAINDDGFVGPHIDFQGRVNQQDVINDLTGDHGDMTAGIAGGAGNLNPLMRGMATGAYMHIRAYSGALPGTVQLHTDSSVLVFSSSYGNGCNGGYTTLTQTVDAEIYQNPSLIQVFSAGNSGTSNCGYGAGSGWGNITGGHKIGKNAIATANLYNDDIVATSSSRGPASDGRIKPDIAAHGQGQMSTDPNNTYASGGGTSAAAPGISGVLAQLHQAYRAMNGGATASSALLKACLLNTANDLGNDGPDFTYGWGKVNAYKALRTLEDNRYFTDVVAQGDSNTHTINIPAGVRRAKIMVYWLDKEASTSSTYALVNDLDATVTDAGSTVHYPWILDPTPNATTLANPATKGVDNLNNMEQVAIDNPAAGVYNLKVKGSGVTFGTQQYYVVYEFLTDEVTLVYPTGGEGITFGQNRVHWDAYGNTSTFDMDYSIDSGQTWTSAFGGAPIPANLRYAVVTVPSVTTGNYMLRITRGAFSDATDTTVSVIGIPSNLSVDRVCYTASAIKVKWSPVANATSYDVFKLGQKYMDYVGNTSDLNFDIPVANVMQGIWYSVRARGPEGAVGRRANAVYYAGAPVQGSSCVLECNSDDDAGVESIDGLANSYEACATPTIPIEVTLKNIGLNTESNFPVYYQLDNGTPIMETFTNSLNPSGTAGFAFATALTLPTTSGSYTIRVWTDLTNDAAPCNDTLTAMIQVIDPIGTFPYVEDFESGTFPPNLSYLLNPDNQTTWTQVNMMGIGGVPSNMLGINNASYNAPGQEDIFKTFNLDLTSGTASTLTFDVAYAEDADSLRVDVSTNCGQNFVTAYYKGGASLSTTGNASSSWIPASAADWKTETVDLTPYLGNNVVIRFVNINRNGNNLYLDNINVNGLAPVPDFAADVTFTCDGTVQFTDMSVNGPTQWHWDFGDNDTSIAQNPIHTYATSGTYTVELRATNGLGSTIATKTAYIVVAKPTITTLNHGESCVNTSVKLSADSDLGDLYWYDTGGNLIHIGDTFNTPTLASATSYDLRRIIQPNASIYSTPTTGGIGGGGYHNTGYTGAVNFTADTSFTIVSAWVDAGSVGPRTLYLWSGSVNGGTPTGSVIDQITVNLTSTGVQRVFLDFQVPSAGQYAVGGTSVDLYRNNGGVSYPYVVPNFLTKTSSSASTPGSFYYYLYDWELAHQCVSSSQTINATVVTADFTPTSTGGLSYSFTDNSVGATTWSWDFGDNNSSSQAGSTSHTYSAPGTYDVVLTINNGSCSITKQITLTITSIETVEGKLGVSMLPNPAQEHTTIQLSQALQETLDVQLVDLAGRVLKNQKLEAGQTQLNFDLGGLAPAVYFVQLKGKDFVETMKLVVNK
ncbi:MAG: S8 family serine peptidase [Aureispira sp.]|nr:S8 family serine peptidase [Aureispira sp.]